jgi:hypothetical protein
MRTSLSEIELIDKHLLKLDSAPDRLLFDALLILNPEMNNKVFLQKKTHALVQQYGRKQLKAEIENVHRQLFGKVEHQTFRQKILSLFYNQ